MRDSTTNSGKALRSPPQLSQNLEWEWPLPCPVPSSPNHHVGWHRLVQCWGCNGFHKQLVDNLNLLPSISTWTMITMISFQAYEVKFQWIELVHSNSYYKKDFYLF
ncbi:hypothetical protein Acr_00g0043410 [Actinidia rufa]|uniref:Uncharacterized protein n=1 Tax=Actinidia rufa TaxID=165716 RepID=A0A7J0DIM4_9ERIC|nr:hypothetical protein Acr_00g0043410 [Actinidia rufa]